MSKALATERDADSARVSQRRHWTAVFGRSALAGKEGGIYAVRRGISEEDGSALWDVCRQLDVSRGVRTRMYDHGTAACAFLDGGIVHVNPAYFGHKDTWVVGSKALRLLCFQLDLTPPRWLKGEISTGGELEAELSFRGNLRTRTS